MDWDEHLAEAGQKRLVNAHRRRTNNSANAMDWKNWTAIRKRHTGRGHLRDCLGRIFDCLMKCRTDIAGKTCAHPQITVGHRIQPPEGCPCNPSRSPAAFQ
jgi:hypothetical protein